MTTETSFYVTGGTLRHDTPCYVERRADQQLFAGLCAGEFCYVLTSRQMGKSSLMNRTAARLRAAGTAVVILDLTGIGRNVTAEQWYGGLLDAVGRQLDLEDALEDFWLDHRRLGPLQRFMAALREVVLPRLGIGSRVLGIGKDPTAGQLPHVATPTPNTQHPIPRLVIFIDEIDTVRSLPFSTDEFFAAIRECYNRRTQEPLFDRLTFCLLGVATPSDLIQDTRTTPFNIGRRIELTDFTGSEAAPMRAGLVLGSAEISGREEAEARTLLDRVLYWTGGHPYLTQRLCQAVAEDPTVKDRAGVDGHSHLLFLSSGAQERDDNLIFARERLLRPATDEPERFDLAALLELYGKVCRGERVPVDDTNPLVDMLRLSGVTRISGVQAFGHSGVQGLRGMFRQVPNAQTPERLNAHLAVRNRIYARVFDRAWVSKHMPDAELRRQKAAYRRGVLRASAVAASVVVVMAGLAVWAMSQARRADRNAATATAQALRANKGEREAREAAERERRQKLAADAARGQAITAERSERTQRQLAERQKQLADERRRAAEQAKLGERRQRLEAQRLLYDADMNVAYSDWNTSPLGRTARLLEEHRPRPGEEDLRGFEWFYLWRLCHRDRFTLAGEGMGRNNGTGSRVDVAFSPDGRRLAMAGTNGIVKLYEATTGRELRTLSGSTLPGQLWGGAAHAHFAADGRRLTTVTGDGTVRFWDLPSGRETRRLRLGPLGGWGAEKRGGVAISPDGRMLAAPDAADRTSVTLRDLTSGRLLRTLETGPTSAGVFSPDGTLLATAYQKSPVFTVTLWDVRTGRPTQPLPGRGSWVPSLAFSPDGRRLAMADFRGFATLWEVATQRKLAELETHQIGVSSVAFSPDGRRLVTGGRDGTAKIWDLGREDLPSEPEETFRGHTVNISEVAFSPDGKALATASLDNTIKVWDVTPPGETALLNGTSPSFTAVRSFGFSPDGKLLATGGWDHTITLWDAATRRKVRTLLGDASASGKIAFSRDGKVLAARSGDGTVAIRDVATGREVRTFPSPEQFALSPDGKLLATREQFVTDVTVTLWEVATGRRKWSLRNFKASQAVTGDIAFSPDGKTLAVGAEESADRRSMVYLLDAVTGRRVRSLETEWEVLSIAFSPGGQRLAAGSVGNASGLWDLATGQRLGTFRYPRTMASLSFSPDGRRLVSTSGDHAVRLWDVATAREVCTLATLPLVGAGVGSVAFSPDGRRLAGWAKGQVWLWEAARPAEVAARETREKAGAR